MPCTNCFNGCQTILSDQCVKYTGNDYPDLNIEKGSTLLALENALITIIQTLQTGEGIIPNYTSADICDFVTDFLPSEGTITLNDVLQAYMDAICSLNDSIESIEIILEQLNESYDLGCLPGDTVSNNTHTVLQALITKACSTATSLTALSLDVSTNYVKIEDIDTYIQDYLDNTGVSTLISNKMVPYAVVEYHGPLGFFDANGAGLGDWDKIYLCNGLNGTPDKRGFISVGVTSGMLGGALNPIVDPAFPGNPAYTIGAINGTNTVAITEAQLASHTHTGTADVNGSHSHIFAGYTDDGGTEDGSGANHVGFFESKVTDLSGDHTHTLTVNATGGGQGHPNVQPGMGCYYIQYRP
jgi:hypothetical protein